MKMGLEIVVWTNEKSLWFVFTVCWIDFFHTPKLVKIYGLHENGRFIFYY